MLYNCDRKNTFYDIVEDSGRSDVFADHRPFRVIACPRSVILRATPEVVTWPKMLCEMRRDVKNAVCWLGRWRRRSLWACVRCVFVCVRMCIYIHVCVHCVGKWCSGWCAYDVTCKCVSGSLSVALTSHVKLLGSQVIATSEIVRSTSDEYSAIFVVLAGHILISSYPILSYLILYLFLNYLILSYPILP